MNLEDYLSFKRKIISSIKEDRKNKNIEVLSSYAAEDIMTYDLIDGRYVNYHLAPQTREWLKSLFIYGRSAEKYRYLEYRVIDLLLHIDPAMLVNLRYIIFVYSKDDVEEIKERIGCRDEAAEFPSIISDEVLGCFWFSMSAVVINIRAIEETAKEITSEYESDGLFCNEADEFDTGLFTTITHEIRHLGLRNPMLSEEDYPLRMESEKEVEQWGIDAYERWRYGKAASAETLAKEYYLYLESKRNRQRLSELHSRLDYYAKLQSDIQEEFPLWTVFPEMSEENKNYSVIIEALEAEKAEVERRIGIEQS